MEEEQEVEEAVGVIIVGIILTGEIVVEVGVVLEEVERCLIALEIGLKVEEAEVILEEILVVEATSEVDFEVAEGVNVVDAVEVVQVFLFREADSTVGKITTMRRWKKTRFFDLQCVQKCTYMMYTHNVQCKYMNHVCIMYNV